MRNVARRENQRIGQGLQGGADLHEALFQRQPGVGQPALRPCGGAADDEIGRNNTPVGQMHRPRFHPHCARAAQHLGARSLDLCAEPVPRAAPEQRQRHPGLDHADLGCRPQTLAGGQRQFHPRHAATDDGHAAPAAARRDVLRKLLPAVGEIVERFDRHRVFAKARQRRHFGRNADVDRGNVIGHRATPFDQHHARRPVDAGGARQNQAGACVAGELHQIELQRGSRVDPGYMPRQHA